MTSKGMERAKYNVSKAETKNRTIQAEDKKSGRVLKSKESLNHMWRGKMKLMCSKPSQKSKQISFSCVNSLFIFSTEKSHKP